MHYLLTEDGYRNFDTKLEGTLAFVDNYFNGDSMAFAKTYYETLSKIPERGNFDIVAHFDIITKYNEQHPFIDTDSKEYMSYAFGAIDALAGKIPFFELNTGAIGRGYRSTPYPCMPILKELAAKGFGAVITSDCHNKLQLDCYFDEARELLSEAGFKSQFVLTNKGFEEISL